MSVKSIKTVEERLDADRDTLMSINSMIHIIANKMTQNDTDQRDYQHVISSLTLIEDLLNKVTDSMGRSHLELFHLSKQYESEGEIA